MKVLIILGSRNPDGQTARAAEAFARGVKAGSGECEMICLPPLDIQRCRQCDANGWGICRTEGKCVIEDDFAAIADKIRGADAVVFATPVYFGDLSESLQALLNRLRRTCTHGDGKVGIAGKPAVGICVAGGGGGGAPRCCFILDWVLQSSGLAAEDMFPVRRQNLEAKLLLLEAAGKRFASL